jgi:hypothetical protein
MIEALRLPCFKLTSYELWGFDLGPSFVPGILVIFSNSTALRLACFKVTSYELWGFDLGPSFVPGILVIASKSTLVVCDPLQNKTNIFFQM